MLSADTNLFLYAANPESAFHVPARDFFATCHDGEGGFVTCELVLVEVYMQLRNPAILRKPLSALRAATFCDQLRQNPRWQHVDYHEDVSTRLWRWARETRSGFRHVIDARLALTLRFHGVSQFATANTKDFKAFGFEKVWNPLG